MTRKVYGGIGTEQDSSPPVSINAMFQSVPTHQTLFQNAEAKGSQFCHLTSLGSRMRISERGLATQPTQVSYPHESGKYAEKHPC